MVIPYHAIRENWVRDDVLTSFWFNVIDQRDIQWASYVSIVFFNRFVLVAKVKEESVGANCDSWVCHCLHCAHPYLCPNIMHGIFQVKAFSKVCYHPDAYSKRNEPYDALPPDACKDLTETMHCHVVSVRRTYGVWGLGAHHIVYCKERVRRYWSKY